MNTKNLEKNNSREGVFTLEIDRIRMSELLDLLKVTLDVDGLPLLVKFLRKIILAKEECQSSREKFNDLIDEIEKIDIMNDNISREVITRIIRGVWESCNLTFEEKIDEKPDFELKF